LEFLTNFDNALDEMEKINGPNDYMTRPLTEVGYATNPAEISNALDEMQKINGPNGYMTRPLTEVGYATNPAERLAQHQSHNSSNRLHDKTIN
jgi:hypothetical protein